MLPNKNLVKITKIANVNGFIMNDKKYKGANSQYSITCENCGFTFSRHYVFFDKNKQEIACPCCEKDHVSSSLRWNVNMIRDYCRINGFKFLSSNYKRSIDKYWFECKCGNKFERTWNDVYSKNRGHCGCSASQKSWTIEKISNIAAENNVKLLSTEYIDYHKQHLEFQCACGNKFKQSLSQFLSTKMFKCHECNGTRIWTLESVRKEIEERGAELISDEYIDNNTPLIMKCKCGNHFSHAMAYLTTKDVLQCGECSGVIKWDIDKCHDYIKQNTTAKMLSTEYTRTIDKYDFICECGEHFTRSWRLIVENHSYFCDTCINGISQGERKIKKFLDDHNIKYIREHTTEGMRSSDGGMLRFDFYLPSLNMAIEFDGEQHYKPIQFGGMSLERAEEEFIKTQERDKSKNQYCKDNNILLHRIPYHQLNNIESILKTIVNL